MVPEHPPRASDKVRRAASVRRPWGAPASGCRCWQVVKLRVQMLAAAGASTLCLTRPAARSKCASRPTSWRLLLPLLGERARVRGNLAPKIASHQKSLAVALSPS